jgi:hypothetical protein
VFRVAWTKVLCWREKERNLNIVGLKVEALDDRSFEGKNFTNQEP